MEYEEEPRLTQLLRQMLEADRALPFHCRCGEGFDTEAKYRKHQERRIAVGVRRSREWATR